MLRVKCVFQYFINAADVWWRKMKPATFPIYFSSFHYVFFFFERCYLIKPAAVDARFSKCSKDLHAL